jgi:hypothetical protein
VEGFAALQLSLLPLAPPHPALPTLGPPPSPDGNLRRRDRCGSGERGEAGAGAGGEEEGARSPRPPTATTAALPASQGRGRWRGAGGGRRKRARSARARRGTGGGTGGQLLWLGARPQAGPGGGTLKGRVSFCLGCDPFQPAGAPQAGNCALYPLASFPQPVAPHCSPKSFPGLTDFLWSHSTHSGSWEHIFIIQRKLGNKASSLAQRTREI